MGPQLQWLTYVALAASERCEALAAGLQGAVWTLGAVPADPTRQFIGGHTELTRSGGRRLTERKLATAQHPLESGFSIGHRADGDGNGVPVETQSGSLTYGERFAGSAVGPGGGAPPAGSYDIVVYPTAR